MHQLLEGILEIWPEMSTEYFVFFWFRCALPEHWGLGEAETGA
jgi:hypothetical protein